MSLHHNHDLRKTLRTHMVQVYLHQLSFSVGVYQDAVI